MARVSSSTQTNTPKNTPSLWRLEETTHSRTFSSCLHSASAALQQELQSYSLLGDEHLDQKDAEEDKRGTAHVVLEHWQVQGSVLEPQEHKHISLPRPFGLLKPLMVHWHAGVYLTCFSKSFFGNQRANLTLSSDLDHCLRE